MSKLNFISRHLVFVIILLSTACIMLASCKKVATNSPNPSSNKPPIANAGGDQTLALPTDSTLLNGGLSSDPDGTIVLYEWTRISGPFSFNIVNSNVIQAQVINLKSGTYLFELKVVDNAGLAAKDTVQVTVQLVDSLTGQEFIFGDLIWQFDWDGAANLYTAVESRPDLFSIDRPVEVSVKSITDTNWVVAKKSPNSPGYVYGIYPRSLFVFPYPNIFFRSQLAGTKVSIKVKFL